MQLAFLSTQTTWGGGENVAAQLLLSLQERGVTVVTSAPESSPFSNWADEQRIQNLRLPGKGRGPKALWRFRHWVQKQNADVLLLNDPHAITYGGLATIGLSIPRIGIRHTCFPVNSGWKHNQLLDDIICVAEAAKQECLKAGVKQSKLQVVYNGLPTTSLKEEQIAKARQTFSSFGDDDTKHLLSVGSLLPVKGFDTTIQALRQALAQGKDWHLWIAGEGPERESLEQLIATKGLTDRVHLLGFRNDVSALLAAADLFVSASHREGLPLVVIEAMQVGVPVIATPVGGCQEIICPDPGLHGQVGWVFEAGDSVGLLSAATEAFNSTDASKVTHAAQCWVNSRFSLEQMTDGYLKVLKERVAA